MIDITMGMGPAVLASIAAAIVATAGLLTVMLRRGWAIRHSHLFTAFAAGVLVTTALTLFPDALASTPNASFFALAGYLVLYGINLLLRASSGNAIVPFLAIGLHSFIDGFQYGVLFETGWTIGLTASAGLIAHEFAEGVILFAVIRAAGVSRFVAFLAAFVGAALTTPAGTIASQVLLTQVSPDMIGMLLAVAAGALLYVGATHLPIHLDGPRTKGLMLVYAFGVFAALALSLTHIHDHGGEHDHEDHHHEASPHEHHDDDPHEAHDH